MIRRPARNVVHHTNYNNLLYMTMSTLLNFYTRAPLWRKFEYEGHRLKWETLESLKKSETYLKALSDGFFHDPS